MIETPEEFERLSNKYFDACVAEDEPPTLAEWAYSLGFESVQSIYDYEKRDGFSYAVKRGRLKILTAHEKGLFRQYCTGHIFWLKNNGGYADRRDLGLSTPNGPIQTDGKIEIILRKPDAS